MADWILLVFLQVVASLPLASGIFTYCRTLKNIHLVRMVNRAEPSKIIEVRKNIVKLKGRTEPIQGRILRTPIEKAPALYYHALIEQERETDESSYWLKIWEKRDWVPFLIKDETGRSGSMWNMPGSRSKMKGERISKHPILLKCGRIS
jgi:hypothetical protein